MYFLSMQEERRCFPCEIASVVAYATHLAMTSRGDRLRHLPRNDVRGGGGCITRFTMTSVEGGVLVYALQ